MDFKIITEKLKYDSFLKIKEGTIEMIDTGKRHNRERVDRTDASVVLIRNVDQNTIVLVEQFRYPTGKKILEAMAGKVDKGESPLDAAIRETREECGYRVKPENIKHLHSSFSTPGYSSEKFHLFYAEVTDSDKLKNEGGGLDDENEYINVVELPVGVFKEKVDNLELEDTKTLLLGMFLKNDHFSSLL